MSRKELTINQLREKEEELRAMGVSRIGIFGSVAREEAHEASDVDVFVEFSPGSHRYKNFNELCDLLDDLLGSNYDVVTSKGLSPYMEGKILEEVVYVPLAS